MSESQKNMLKGWLIFVTVVLGIVGLVALGVALGADETVTGGCDYVTGMGC